jgi:hypothetical protein
MIVEDTVELMASLEQFCHEQGLYSRCASRHTTLDVCAWRMKTEIQRLKLNSDFERRLPCA